METEVRVEQVRRIRKQRGLSQAKLAAQADIDPSTVNQVEMGRRKPSTATLEKLADALSVEVADLFPKGQAPLFDPEDQRREDDGEPPWYGEPGFFDADEIARLAPWLAKRGLVLLAMPQRDFADRAGGADPDEAELLLAKIKREWGSLREEWEQPATPQAVSLALFRLSARVMQLEERVRAARGSPASQVGGRNKATA